jgi:hypothetical protein
MLIENEANLQLGVSDDFFPRNPNPLLPEKARDALQSHMIVGFEEALELGMAPMDALGCVLRWVALEMGRMNQPITSKHVPGTR